MKNNFKYIFYISFLGILYACSVKKDAFINKKWHGLNTKYNVMHNGNLAVEKGIIDVKATYSDDFWEILPLERMQNNEEQQNPGETKNPNFKRAETKATKAIQKHSMNIGGYEKNSQIDESYLLLGKARYYEHRYLPALDAFNYVLYKYPNSNTVYQAQVWREKVNLKLENEAIVIKNLNRTLKGQVVKGQDLADINAVLTQAYIVTKDIDSAVATIKIAKKETKSKEEKARYTFILGQLYEKLNYSDSASIAYSDVIKMKRKSPRSYTAFSHFKLANLNIKNIDSIAFNKSIDKLLNDIEFKKHRDIVYHQRALFYDRNNNKSIAIKNYYKSIKNQGPDRYLIASNYRNISEIYFKEKNFAMAKKYLDTTFIHITEKNSEYKSLNKKLDILTEVVKYQNIIKNTDSITLVFNMSPSEKIKYYRNFIDELKKNDSIKKLIKENFTSVKNAQDTYSLKENLITDEDPVNSIGMMPPSPTMGAISLEPPTINNLSKSLQTSSNFYFYNPTTVAQGKIAFQKKWGKRNIVDNWKTIKLEENKIGINENNEDTEDVIVEVSENEKEAKYTTSFYINQLPKEQKAIDSLGVDANYSRFKLGIIFKEKLKEFPLAKKSFEDVLDNKPIAKLKLPTYYNLYQLYSIDNVNSAFDYQQKIITEFPDSNYALSFKSSSTPINLSETEFKNVYKLILDAKFREALPEVEMLVKKYDGDEVNAKFDFLKAKVEARLFGLEAYKKTLQKIVTDYPKSEEATKVKEILEKEIPTLEAIKFGADSKTYNLVFVTAYPNETSHKVLLEKLAKYAKESGDSKVKVSNDIYNLQTNCIVLHNLINKQTAESIYNFLQENKEFKIKNKAIIISNEDYKVIQINKNLEEYLASIK